MEYRKHELDGAPEENFGEWAANQIEEVILREGPDTVGALCLEPVTAGGGVIEAPEGYWQRVQEICKKYDVLLHIDEVVCGVGRTGTWFGYQQYGIKPDSRDHGQRRCLGLCGDCLHGHHRRRSLTCSRTIASDPDELFPRHLDLWRLHRRSGCGG